MESRPQGWPDTLRPQVRLLAIRRRLLQEGGRVSRCKASEVKANQRHMAKKIWSSATARTVMLQYLPSINVGLPPFGFMQIKHDPCRGTRPHACYRHRHFAAPQKKRTTRKLCMQALVRQMEKSRRLTVLPSTPLVAEAIWRIHEHGLPARPAQTSAEAQNRVEYDAANSR